MNAYSLKAVSFLLFAASLAAQAGSAQLADGRILTLVQPPRTFLTEGPITAVNAGSQQLDAQGVTVTIPASVNGVAFQMLGTNFNGAPITAATIHALLDENARGRASSRTRQESNCETNIRFGEQATTLCGPIIAFRSTKCSGGPSKK